MEMGSVSRIVVAVVFAAIVGGGSCMPAGPNISTNYDGRWLSARATWYGKANGAGPSNSGGACGINRVNLPPYNSMSSCGNLPIFKDGKGCGSCYQVKCVKPASACSGKPVMVTITDVNYENLAPYRFDLSGTAFGAMAMEGKENALRRTGVIDLQFRRVPCKYFTGTKIVFHVEKGSNPNYLAVLVKFVAGDGNIVQMDLKDKASSQWMPMRQSWGAIWRMDTGRPLRGPFCIRLTSESGKQRVAYDVIPAKYVPGTFYTSNIQF